MDAAQWPQGLGLSKQQVEAPRPQATTEKKPRPQKDQAVNCPRCNSTNTKFCYYNNYNLSQPRYFCKACRRYWTEGGTLRNVPVGGGSRKNKRSISTSTTSSSSLLSKKPIIQDLSIPSFSNLPPQNPKITHGSSQDLNLAYPPISSNNYSSFSNLVSLQANPNNMDFLKNGISSSKGLHTFMPMPMPISDCNSIYSSSGGIPLHDFKPTLNFSLNGFDTPQNVFGSNIASGTQDSSEKIFLPPFDNLKQLSSTTQFEQNRGQGGQDSNSGYFNGMFGGYSW